MDYFLFCFVQFCFVFDFISDYKYIFLLFPWMIGLLAPTTLDALSRDTQIGNFIQSSFFPLSSFSFSNLSTLFFSYTISFLVSIKRCVLLGIPRPLDILVLSNHRPLVLGFCSFYFLFIFILGFISLQFELVFLLHNFFCTCILTSLVIFFRLLSFYCFQFSSSIVLRSLFFFSTFFSLILRRKKNKLLKSNYYLLSQILSVMIITS